MDKLVTQAEQHGQATALEVEPAMAAIRQLQGVVDQDAVASRMAALETRMIDAASANRAPAVTITRGELDDRLANLLALAKSQPTTHKSILDRVDAAIGSVYPTLDEGEVRSLSSNFRRRLVLSDATEI